MTDKQEVQQVQQVQPERIHPKYALQARTLEDQLEQVLHAFGEQHSMDLEQVHKLYLRLRGLGTLQYWPPQSDSPTLQKTARKTPSPLPTYECYNCHKFFTKPMLARWHNDNCKFKGDLEHEH
jgi:hypothetical protein